MVYQLSSILSDYFQERNTRLENIVTMKIKIKNI